MAPSPFQNTSLVPAAPSPFPTLQTGTYAAAPAETTGAQAGADLINAIKRAFPETGTMPVELKEVVEKAEANSSKMITQELHKATANLGRAQRSVRELEEAKDRHKQQWMTHLAESLVNWKQQMTSFDEQQTHYMEQITQAKTNAEEAHVTIQKLNAKAAGKSPQEVESVAPRTEETVVVPDLEETRLRNKLHGILAECAMKLSDKVPPPLIKIGSDSEGEDKPGAKRHRSVSPGSLAAAAGTSPALMDTSGAVGAVAPVSAKTGGNGQ